MPGTQPASQRPSAGVLIPSRTEDGQVAKGWVPFVQSVDANGAAIGPSGQQPSANSQSVTPASDTPPFPIAGRYSSTVPTYADNQNGTVLIDNRGGVRMILAGGGDTVSGSSPAVISSAINSSQNTGYKLAVANYLYDSVGNTMNVARGDFSGAFNAGAAFYTENTTAVPAGATIPGVGRANGGAAGIVATRFNMFVAEAHTDVTGGTLYIDRSVDGGTTWRQTASVSSTVAGTTATVSVRITAGMYRARYVNGATAVANFLLTTAYTVA
jgi:hypothetical protein